MLHLKRLSLFYWKIFIPINAHIVVIQRKFVDKLHFTAHDHQAVNSNNSNSDNVKVYSKSIKFG